MGGDQLIRSVCRRDFGSVYIFMFYLLLLALGIFINQFITSFLEPCSASEIYEFLLFV